MILRDLPGPVGSHAIILVPNVDIDRFITSVPGYCRESPALEPLVKECRVLAVVKMQIFAPWQFRQCFQGFLQWLRSGQFAGIQEDTIRPRHGCY